MGASPVGVPTAAPGKSAAALANVRLHLEGLTKELSNFEPGSAAYKALYDVIGKLSKIAPPSAGVPGVEQTALRNLAQNAQQSSMMQSLMRSMGGGGGAPAAPSSPAGAQPAVM